MSIRDQAEEFGRAIGLCLAQMRQEQNLSAYSLAQKSGVSPQTIGYYERGERRPSMDCLVKLAFGLGLQPSELLRRVEQLVKEAS